MKEKANENSNMKWNEMKKMKVIMKKWRRK